MDLVKITELTVKLGVSARSLRYYEEMGLIKSVRSDFEKYRSFDAENIERLKQILVLRKMQISIKDIVRIYENADMSVVVEVFVSKLNEIDNEVNSLGELKKIVGDFLQTMLKNGITKISAIPILYEEMDKKFENLVDLETFSYEKLTEIDQKLTKSIEISLILLPKMRVLSSFLKDNLHISDSDNFRIFLQEKNLMNNNFGLHEQFEFQIENEEIIILKIDENFVNDSIYSDYVFDGGLFAATNVYLDQDLSEKFYSLIKEFNDNKYYQIDYNNNGSLRHSAMIENIISPDDQRKLVSLLVPVKKRTANFALFEKSVEIPEKDITIDEIEAQNPILWTVDVPFESITPINNPHFRITETSEMEFYGQIIRAVLNTNVSVKLPFRIDMEFRQEKKYGGAIVFYFGEDVGYYTGGIGKLGFGVNIGNNVDFPMQDIRFHQPIFHDQITVKGRGAVKAGEYNHLTWIVGEKQLAVIINGEVRYCGINFPYMSMDFNLETPKSIVIGSSGGNDVKYFRSIRVSQLIYNQKNKIKKEELTMITKQSNNIIPIIHRLVTDEYGENYWFNGCGRYVMECLGEKDYDYWFFAGLTGDIFTQHYHYTNYSGDAVSSYMTDENVGGNPVEFFENIFYKCGYAATFVSNKDLRKNTEMYLNTLIAYIDKGVPVIVWGKKIVGVFVGYEDYGKVLLYITGNSEQPERITLDVLHEKLESGGLVFVGEKKREISLANLYKDAIFAIPTFSQIKTDDYCFGAEAFRAWADDIENGKFDGMAVEGFDYWGYYTNYVCVLATNGSCCHGFLNKVMELNVDLGFLKEVDDLYTKLGKMWIEDLEGLGGGFNITLETLQDKVKRVGIAAKLRECAEITDEIMRIIEKNS